jgi:ubiquinone/menaquinone biosynthesis C-methylase UbiE
MALPARARVLDLCCGTGLSTRALVRACPDADVVALDASREMVALARRKPELGAVRFLVGDAMDPAAAGAEGPFDGVMMAYGIRNVPDPDLCLTRVRALLRPGGVVCFHEYSVADSRAARVVWNAVAAGVIVPLGAAATGSGELFRYLRRSVLAFDGVRAFEARLRRRRSRSWAAAPARGRTSWPAASPSRWSAASTGSSASTTTCAASCAGSIRTWPT